MNMGFNTYKGFYQPNRVLDFIDFWNLSFVVLSLQVKNKPVPDNQGIVKS